MAQQTVQAALVVYARVKRATARRVVAVVVEAVVYRDGDG